MPSVYPVIPPDVPSLARGERPCVVYGLVDPRSRLVRYVGYTIHPKDRFESHYSAQEMAYDTNKNRWLKGLLRRGLKARMVLLEECRETEAGDLERVYIAAYKARGYKLTNGTAGGKGSLGNIQSAETRALKSRVLSGKKRTPEQRARMSASQKARNRSSEEMAALSALAQGKPRPPLTPEHRANVAASLKRLAQTPEWQEIHAEHYASLRGQPLPADHPFRKGTFTGRRHTAETKAKMRLAARRVWQERKEKQSAVD